MTRKELVESVIRAVELPAWLRYVGCEYDRVAHALRFKFERQHPLSPLPYYGVVSISDRTPLRSAEGLIREELDNVIDAMRTLGR